MTTTENRDLNTMIETLLIREQEKQAAEASVSEARRLIHDFIDLHTQKVDIDTIMPGMKQHDKTEARLAIVSVLNSIRSPR